MRKAVVLAAAAAALAFPAGAWAHAALLKTVPSASGTVDTAPQQVRLTFSEAVEPKFAIVSVTDANANQETTGGPARDPQDADTLVVPLQRLAEGWYLVYWRVISVDGHPVRGAFTFAVGPNPGPAPQFVVPSISETAATPQLVVLRFLAFLALMTAIGLYVLRMLIARPLVVRVGGTRLRELSLAFFAAASVTLVLIPVYMLFATAQFALRSFSDLGALVPLIHVSAFGRGYLSLELLFALFTAAAAASIAIDRPERAQRSLAELFALGGTLLAAGATLLVPGLAGHAAQTTPRTWSLLFDWIHLATGAVWIGGLVGLLVLWRSLPVARRVAGLLVSVPRFSNVAFVSVNLLIASGTAAAIVHLPTFASLWQTSYGKTIVAKVLLIGGALVLAAVNLLRTKPSLAGAETGERAALMLRRLVGAEVVVVGAAIFAAALLSSLPPPPKALAEAGGAEARVGPGPVSTIVERNGYRVEVSVTPNKAAVPNAFTVRLTKDGKPVGGATVTATFAMLDMEMGQQAATLPEVGAGTYRRAAPALVMVGHWGLGFQVAPPGAQPFEVLIVDRAAG